MTVWVVCVQPPTVPPRAGKTLEAGPLPASLTVLVSWKLPRLRAAVVDGGAAQVGAAGDAAQG